jgi:hypothetical protein
MILMQPKAQPLEAAGALDALGPVDRVNDARGRDRGDDRRDTPNCGPSEDAQPGANSRVDRSVIRNNHFDAV